MFPICDRKDFENFLIFNHDCIFCSDYTVQEHFSSPCSNICTSQLLTLNLWNKIISIGPRCMNSSLFSFFFLPILGVCPSSILFYGTPSFFFHLESRCNNVALLTKCRPEPIWITVRKSWFLLSQHQSTISTYPRGPESASIEIPPFIFVKTYCWKKLTHFSAKSLRTLKNSLKFLTFQSRFQAFLRMRCFYAKYTCIS